MFDDVRQWQGTAEALTETLKQQIARMGVSVDSPAPRTIRLWRSKQLFSQAKGQPFAFRQILEGLATAILLKKGWTLAAIAQILPSFPDNVLERQIIAESNNQDPNWSPTLISSVPLPTGFSSNIDLAEDAVILLAQGIERLYIRLLDERDIIRQDDQLPPELCKAMSKLGRLYIEQGLPDEAACVHTILNRARYPLNDDQWKLQVFQQPNFLYSRATLIEPELRVPTADCSEIARSRGGFGEDNVVERRLYNELKEMTEKLGSRRQHQAYTALRMLFGKYSLIRERQLLDYLDEHDLTPLQRQVIDKFFDRVPEIWSIEGKAYRCANCGTLLHPHPNTKRFPNGRCPIRQCMGYFSGKVSEKLDYEQALVAKPQILTYWTAPAIDELAIYETAKKLGLNAELYPESDRCDIAINDRAIGIDAKSYTSPVTLALRLNRNIGGLIHYHRRLIAVSDWLVQDYPDYLSMLRQTLNSKGEPATLEVKSVAEVIQLLRGI